MTVSAQIAAGLSRIGTVLRAGQWARSEDAALTPTQAQILVYLAARGPARVTAVAEEIAVTQPTASDAVAALVRKGLVEKRPDPGDARATRLHTTPAGRRKAKAVAVWPDALLAALDTLETDEQAAFLKGLTKMIRSLQTNGAIPVQRMCASCRYFQPNVHADAAAPHHCEFVNAAFGDTQLRLDCADHVAAADADAAYTWRRFAPSKESGAARPG